MSRDGNGNYVLPPENPVTPGTVIESEWANATMSDLGQAISTSIASDGQTPIVNNLPMNGFKHTGVASATARNNYATLGQVQDGAANRVSIVSGINDLAGTVIGQMGAYVAGQIFSFQATVSNTGPATLNINGIGALSIVDVNSGQLQSGDLTAGEFYVVIYTGTVFQLLVDTTTATETVALQTSITGWTRPGDDQYPPVTQVNSTTVRVPAGSGYIVAPGDDGAVSPVSWAQQDVILSYVASSYMTTLFVDAGGGIVQIAGRVDAQNYRIGVALCRVTHFGGTIAGISMAPAVYGDDDYLGRDTSDIFNGTLVAGGAFSQASANSLGLDIQQGEIFIPGGAANIPLSPNVAKFATQSFISFRPLAGAHTMSAATQIAPVTSYDPAGSGVVTAIPAANNAVIHRLYWMYGTWIWVYGQQVYATLNEAAARMVIDDAQYKPSFNMAGAVFVGHIIATKGCLALGDTATCVLVPKGGFQYVIGGAGGIGEAPVDGKSYGRKNALWSEVAAGSSFTTDVLITKGSPLVHMNFTPYGAGEAGSLITNGANNWFKAAVDQATQTYNIRGYNPANGNLLNTTSLNLTTGLWNFPNAGNGGANRAVQSSATDTTAGALMAVGAFGLGGGRVITNANSQPASGGTGANFSLLDTPHTNGPTTDYYTLWYTGSASDGTQVAVKYGTGSMYSRTLNATVWSAWIPVVTGFKQTSATDTTAGALMAVGAFGIGGDASLVTDCNTARTSGIFLINDTTINAPVAGMYGFLFVQRANTQTVTQIVTRYDIGTGSMYYRNIVSGIDYPWNELTTANKINKIIISAAQPSGGSDKDVWYVV